ncbi:MAG: hypothetical protein CVV41_14410 [Candidatus Riflebacteria bacterium HGW-Riflebacteria-1]|jgi:prepilin-type N-terminal cleavage/methylation domain-containing protein|nr:MAG: hypothetical protein CVV41_14410 [Candidatus Riflebacteria bacterium HGW-Riflebacteria-1]
MNRREARPVSKSGYSLMEVLAGLAIISIVSSIVLPGMANFFSGMQVKAEGEIFVQNVRLARYKAIEQQAVYRLIFDTDPSSVAPSAYRVQVHSAFDDPPIGTYDGTTHHDGIYNSTYWFDAIEAYEITFDTGTEIKTNLPRTLYFWPNGQIYTNPDITSALAAPIAEQYIGFGYGSSIIKVIITPMGVFSSESYTGDMVNIENDSEVLW